MKTAPWIYFGSFSKVLIPVYVCWLLIAHPDLITHLRLKQAADPHTNRPGQWLALEYMNSADKPQRLGVCAEFTVSVAMRLPRHWRVNLPIWRNGKSHPAGCFSGLKLKIPWIPACLLKLRWKPGGLYAG